tara:strand:+ start:42567 stop:42785 length:219 start_codon:yes stop_codon:yes gene_type:complete
LRRLLKDVTDGSTVEIGQAEVAASVDAGLAFVVQAEPMQNRETRVSRGIQGSAANTLITVSQTTLTGRLFSS